MFFLLEQVHDFRPLGFSILPMNKIMKTLMSKPLQKVSIWLLLALIRKNWDNDNWQPTKWSSRAQNNQPTHSWRTTFQKKLNNKPIYLGRFFVYLSSLVVSLCTSHVSLTLSSYVMMSTILYNLLYNSSLQHLHPPNLALRRHHVIETNGAEHKGDLIALTH